MGIEEKNEKAFEWLESRLDETASSLVSKGIARRTMPVGVTVSIEGDTVTMNGGIIVSKVILDAHGLLDEYIQFVKSLA